MLSDENHPSVNPHVNHYHVKKRAESYNNKRRTDDLDELDQLINGDGEPGIEDNQVEYEYIQSKNMKQNSREVRAPSSGSSGSQPRV